MQNSFVRRIQSVAPVQLGKMLGILYGLISLIIFIPMGLIMMVAGAFSGAAAADTEFGAAAGAAPFLVAIVMMIGAPIAYALMGFLGGLIAALVYNVCAKWVGGIEITLEDVPQAAGAPALPPDGGERPA